MSTTKTIELDGILSPHEAIEIKLGGESLEFQPEVSSAYVRSIDWETKGVVEFLTEVAFPHTAERIAELEEVWPQKAFTAIFTELLGEYSDRPPANASDSEGS